MKINVLGTRGEIKPSEPLYSKHSGILINDELLLDFGEKEFLKHKPRWILISHLHPDHAIFVKEKVAALPKFIFGPEKNKNVKMIVAEKKFKIGKYEVTPIPTHHSKLVKSQAYRIDSNGKSVLYTGDIIWMDKKYHPLLKGLDLIITEGSFIKKGGLIVKDKETGKIFGHNGIPDLIHLFKPFSKKILLVHFGKWFLKDIETGKAKIKKLSKQEKVDILVGYEGMKLTVQKKTLTKI